MSGWTRHQEPIASVLVRNIGIGLLVGAVFAVAHQQVWLWLPVSALALWFSLGGHFVEIGFLEVVRPRIPKLRAAQVVARVATWFLGGVVLYLLMAATAPALTVVPPRLEWWWFGGAAFMSIEFVAHGVLALRGKPNFYDGRG